MKIYKSKSVKADGAIHSSGRPKMAEGIDLCPVHGTRDATKWNIQNQTDDEEQQNKKKAAAVSATGETRQTLDTFSL